MSSRPRTLRVFNKGLPLRVVRVDDGRLGVVDEETQKVWVEHAIVSCSVETAREVPLPVLPEHYGAWRKKSIGGVSSTVRRVGILRPRTRVTSGEAVTLFATRAPDADTIAKALHDSEGNVLSTEWDEQYGHVSEVRTAVAALSRVAALVARAGATPLLEDASLDSMREIGVERLDRIEARVVQKQEAEDLYGLRRGDDNWRFPWLPDHWTEVPITWDHMVENVLHEDIHTLPEPLRQHVARMCIERGLCTNGTQWKETTPLTREEEVGGNVMQRSLLDCAELSRHVEQSLRITADDLHRWNLFRRIVPWKHVVRTDDGRCFKPVNTEGPYQQYASTTRYVSAALTETQSKQIIETFYLLNVEEVAHEETRHALCLIMFHYMKERGYTARWLGKYEQKALHIGNGDNLRRFRGENTHQYNGFVNEGISAMPAEVISKLWGRDGRLHTRGSKGTRSKHKQNGKKRYVPTHRLERSRETELRMAGRDAL